MHELVGQSYLCILHGWCILRGVVLGCAVFGCPILLFSTASIPSFWFGDLGWLFGIFAEWAIPKIVQFLFEQLSCNASVFLQRSRLLALWNGVKARTHIPPYTFLFPSPFFLGYLYTDTCRNVSQINTAWSFVDTLAARSRTLDKLLH